MKTIQNPKCTFFNLTNIILSLLMVSLTSNVYASLRKDIQQLPNEQANQATQSGNQDTIYNFVEKMPQFPGGEKEVVKFLSQTMRYPEDAQKKDEHGKVIVQFVISKTGKVEKAKVLKGVSPELDKEALRVINLLPDWIPGEQNGEKVAVYRIVPILFKTVSAEDAWEMNEKTVVVIDNVKMPANFNTTILNLDKIASVSVLKPFPEKEKSKLMSKYGSQAANGVILITSNKTEIQYSLPDSTNTLSNDLNAPCKENAIKPLFLGGEEKLLNYIADSIQYPFVAKRLKTEGKVFVRFMVDKAGKVSNATIVRSVDYFLNKEAMRVINILPDWTPGVQCNKKINFLITLPVTFKLDLPATDNKEWVRNDKTVILLDGARLPSTFQLEWLRYENLSSYQVLQPTTKEITKKLVAQYGRDAVNGVILIGSIK